MFSKRQICWSFVPCFCMQSFPRPGVLCVLHIHLRPSLSHWQAALWADRYISLGQLGCRLCSLGFLRPQGTDLQSGKASGMVWDGAVPWSVRQCRSRRKAHLFVYGSYVQVCTAWRRRSRQEGQVHCDLRMGGVLWSVQEGWVLFEHMDAQSYTLDHGSCSAVLTLKLVNGLARRKRPESAPTSEGFAKQKVIPLVLVNVFQWTYTVSTKTTATTATLTVIDAFCTCHAPRL